MNEKDMLFIEHLDEFRKRLIITLSMFVINLCVAVPFAPFLYEYLVHDYDGNLALLGLTDVVWIYLSLAGVVAIALTIPIAFYNIWKFIQPALKEGEATLAIKYIPSIFILFCAGISFGYFIVFPTVLNYLMSIAVGNFEMVFTAHKYFETLFLLTLPFGFLFQLPLVVLFLTRVGILSTSRLERSRKVAYFFLVIITVIITPPDIISDILVMVPLLLLYEIGIVISKWGSKRNNK
ncbi:twin-arginine translocase subunit TatC [Cytobacillus oceanisediminis]|uniref:twin-arginine translocase subunit TatC n=1 Tax=Cytobacillus oceanisediminis TaxID=665099 RepID=UPI001C241FD6|nr:twin-arginine translocase subunit TatC [Cytobacillus oceanisediminis]MBU8772097.1 twin-arginine translocase subunit TatC [Cytobacillus oceanisediminis]